ncbi:uncharacterized protein METZ01_LOCUS463168 [marine metagenome]|uniref:Uncharacterized protein n=1 Tax=marine metagenome TaxID=408172 RepID=A0A383ARK1_9ZZZZ
MYVPRVGITEAGKSFLLTGLRTVSESRGRAVQDAQCKYNST